MHFTWREFADHMETRVSENISVQVLNGTPQRALLGLNMWPTHIACLFPIRFYTDNFNLCNFCSLRHWKNLSWWTPVVLGSFCCTPFETICIRLQTSPFKLIMQDTYSGKLKYLEYGEIPLKKELVMKKGAKMNAISIGNQTKIFTNKYVL